MWSLLYIPFYVACLLAGLSALAGSWWTAGIVFVLALLYMWIIPDKDDNRGNEEEKSTHNPTDPRNA